MKELISLLMDPPPPLTRCFNKWSSYMKARVILKLAILKFVLSILAILKLA